MTTLDPKALHSAREHLLAAWEFNSTEEAQKIARAAIVAYDAAKPSGWQPIKSAPRDGTLILLAFGRDTVSAGAYHRNDDDLFPWKFIDSQGEGLPIFNGARDDTYGPTHWQPMPSYLAP